MPVADSHLWSTEARPVTSSPTSESSGAPDLSAPPGALASAAPAVPAWYPVTRARRPDAKVMAIPPAARAAYERAATVIAAAEPGCRLSWHLLAAIGRTTTDHGRVTSFSLITTHLDGDGTAVPAIVGPVLHEGQQSLVSDTDAGALDHDPTNDRAVGPLHLTPMLWAHVGLDADNDGARDPQDIDDAALATAVLLCSAGLADLRSPNDQATALALLNASPAFARRVVPLATAYAADDDAHPPTPPLVVPVPGSGSPPSSALPSPEATATVKDWFQAHRDDRWSDAPSLPSWSPEASPSPWETCPTGSPAASPTATPSGAASACATPTLEPAAPDEITE